MCWPASQCDADIMERKSKKTEHSARPEIRAGVSPRMNLLYHRDAREYSNPAHHSKGARSTCARRDARERESMR